MTAALGLKVFARSRSTSFVRDYLERQSESEGDIDSVRWRNGDGLPVYYRRGTSDVALVYDILLKPGRKSEYWLPEGIDARVILDIGGNIGITARYLAHRFPQARIHSFEPIPANCALMRRNFAGTTILGHEFGLGNATGEVEFSIAAGGASNYDGFSRFRTPENGARSVRAQVRAVPEALAQLGLAGADIIKLDVEGAEHDVIAAFPDSVLQAATWIYGELHTRATDPQLAFRFLERLAPWFDIAMVKSLRQRNWFFDACNRNASDRFRSFRRGN